MDLQKLTISAGNKEIVDYIKRCTGIGGDLLNGGEQDPGTVALIVRPSAGDPDDRLKKTLGDVRRASALGIPVLVIAGAPDPIGAAIAKEAGSCGVPDQCLLYVRDGKLVDALGNVISDALRGTGVGVRAAVDYASRIAHEELVPELTLWDAGPAGEVRDAALWEPGEKMEPASAPAGAQRTGGGQIEALPPRLRPVTAEAAQASPWNAYLEQAGKVVAVFGIKNGVGASTVAACLSGVLGDHGSLCLEVSPSATGHVYFGGTPADAVKTGKYACCTEKTGPQPDRDVPILIVDAVIPAAMDEVYKRADCVVVVTDGSPVAFDKVAKWIKGGWRIDVIVINRVVSGTGYPPEVYMGEFGLERVLGVPGGLEEEAAVNLAQRSAALPLGKSVDLDAAFAGLAETVLERLETQ